MENNNKTEERPDPCRFGATYWEDVAGDGGSRMEMFDCNYEGDIDISKSESCRDCPAYKPLLKVKCEKHGLFFYKGDSCCQCEVDLFNEINKAGKEWERTRRDD